MSEPSPSECKYSTWRWLNVKTGEVRPFNCGSWNCRQHQGVVAWRWAVRLAEAIPHRMITLTAIPPIRARAYLAFQGLVRDIRQEHFAFEYVRFLEVGRKTGMLHYHLAEKGSYIPQKWLSLRAEANGLGRVVDIRATEGRGPGWYLSKYITKEGVPPGWRKVAYSRGFFPHPESAQEPSQDWKLDKSQSHLYYRKDGNAGKATASGGSEN